MRYFLFSYVYLLSNKKTDYQYGTTPIESSTFPSLKFIKAALKRYGQKEIKDLCILNIYEFKWKEDYDNYSSEEEPRVILKKELE